ncbi:MAG TPA: hypothetical protein VG265_13420 [Gaiellaceae bacterium]|jgi:hypothetical protein|nr:hypothetical protein [Gaiellaceae bacterium]
MIDSNDSTVQQRVEVQFEQLPGVTVKGHDVIELRARAWDELQKILGPSKPPELEPLEADPDFDLEFDVAPMRDPLDEWSAHRWTYGPNPDRYQRDQEGNLVRDESGKPIVNEDEPPLMAGVDFVRDGVARVKFA